MNNISTNASIHTVPNEILEFILSYTNYPSAIVFVCKEWREMNQNPQTTFAFLKDRKIRLGIEGVIEKSKTTADVARIAEIQTVFLARLKPTRLECLISKEKVNFFKTLPPSITTLLYFHELEQDLNLLTFFKVLEKQAGVLAKPQNEDGEQEGIRQQASRIREILKQNQAVLQTITKIDLARLGMTAVPEELNLLTEVVSVSLAMNNIHTIPTNFGSTWTKLNSLNLGFNQIEHLPVEFGREWKVLKSLDLSHNRIASFPDRFGANWLKLQHVEIQGNCSKITVEKLKKRWPKIDTYR
ncbi:hypothetical protein PNK_2014 [Candidatus Protochlamydia naegleriophila]|uniref:Uncharacterized protein n=1 Tax=Candidatus Protochlamydia naegleriophila TaxID=389348 RepID=A0A0U5JG83_9BACT|nr:hypothetical protein [Candidatus Protochlamydia naegleriophila]CUI17618.1 hypothetical protein PNK_2014 [Candidatus Protochlamydia naegleriophila]